MILCSRRSSATRSGRCGITTPSASSSARNNSRADRTQGSEAMQSFSNAETWTRECSRSPRTRSCRNSDGGRCPCASITTANCARRCASLAPSSSSTFEKSLRGLRASSPSTRKEDAHYAHSHRRGIFQEKHWLLSGRVSEEKRTQHLVCKSSRELGREVRFAYSGRRSASVPQLPTRGCDSCRWSIYQATAHRQSKNALQNGRSYSRQELWDARASRRRPAYAGRSSCDRTWRTSRIERSRPCDIHRGQRRSVGSHAIRRATLEQSLCDLLR